MMNRMMVAVLLLSLAVSLPVAAAPAEELLTVAVMPFEEGGVQLDYSWGSKLLEGLTQMVTDKLASQPNLQVLERSRIEQIFAEQNLQQSQWIDETQTIRIGKLLGARMLIFGTLTDFGLKSTGGITFGPVTLTGTKATVAFTARVVDAETGVILGSISARGENTGSSFLINDLNGISFGSKEFTDSTLGKAFDAALAQFITDFQPVIEKAKSRVVRSEEQFWGRIAAVAGKYVIIKTGSNDGIRPGMVFKVFQMIEVEGLRDPVRIPVGSIKIISVDPEAAVGVPDADTDIGDLDVGFVVEKE